MEWYEDESFWMETYPFLFPEKRFKLAEEEADQLLQLLDFQGTSILDLCCGPGRFAVPLARRGFQVTGVDRSDFLLDKARATASEAHLKIEWVRQDMRQFSRSETFDLVLSMYTSFGYFDDKTDDLSVLQNIHASLKPNGVVVIDLMSKERLARRFQSTTSDRLEDGTLMVQRHEIFDEWTRIRNEWMIVKDDLVVHSFHFHHTIYSGQELRDRLADIGFAEIRLFGNLDGDAYGREADRLIAVARR